MATMPSAPKKRAIKRPTPGARLHNAAAEQALAEAADPKGKGAAKKVAAPKKQLSAKAAVKKAKATPKPKATPKVKVKAPVTTEPELTDDEFVQQEDEHLQALAVTYAAKRKHWYTVSETEGEDYAPKGGKPTPYQQAEQEVYALEAEISKSLGVPSDFWDVTDDGELAWDEEALDDPTLFDDDGASTDDIDEEDVVEALAD